MPGKQTYKERKVSATFLVYSTGFTLISVLILGMIFTFLELRDFEKASQNARISFINSQKERVRIETEKVFDYIHLTRMFLEDNMKSSLRSRVTEAWDMMSNIYDANKGILPEHQIKKIVKDALRPVRFFNDRGYYFIVSMDGTEELYPVAPQFEGKNLLDLQDENGNFVIRDEIAIIDKQGEGFVTDYWTKPGAAENMVFPKTSFVRLFKPLNWYVGCGEYLDNFDKDLQGQIKQRIRNIHFGKDGYVFVDSYSGHAVVIDDINIIILNKLETEKLLRENEARFRTIFENVPVMIAVLDKNLNYRVWNHETKKYFDVHPDQKLNKAALDNFLTTSLVNRNFMNHILSFDGSFKEYEIKTRLGIKNQNWAVFRTDTYEIILVGYDITEMKNYQIRLKELNDSKDKFFSILSHDLHSPFNTIIGYSDLLLVEYDRYSDAQRRNFIKKIHSSSMAMHKLLVNLLDWARSQTGKLEVTTEKFNLHEVAEIVFEILNPQAEKKNIRIQNDIDNGHFAFTDRSMTLTVLQNLVANGIKFTHSGGSISLNASLEKDELKVSVTDTGIGIRKEIAEKIFTISGSITNKGTANESGTGLGLVICKEFVEKMGGKIWVESEPGKGSTFCFTLKIS
nr:cache domain-containing protein [Bacteroidota bacterium]